MTHGTSNHFLPSALDFIAKPVFAYPLFQAQDKYTNTGNERLRRSPSRKLNDLKQHQLQNLPALAGSQFAFVGFISFQRYFLHAGYDLVEVSRLPRSRQAAKVVVSATREFSPRLGFR